MDEQSLQAIIDASGAIAEMSAIFYNAVVDKVKSEDVAMKLTSIFMSTMINRNH